MDEIKRLYALEWYGPYESIEDIWNDDDTQSCSIYLITGKEPYDSIPVNAFVSFCTS